MIDRVHRELTDEDIEQIANTYCAWRGDQDSPQVYQDVAGFCKIATLDEIRQHGHILTPGRYVGAAEVEDDGEPFEDKMQRLVAKWSAAGRPLHLQVSRAETAAVRIITLYEPDPDEWDASYTQRR